MNREECKKIIEETIIRRTKAGMKMVEENITVELMDAILFYTGKCRDKLLERIYWIMNGIEEYPKCKECGRDVYPGFHGLKTGYRGGIFCSRRCSSNNSETKEKNRQTCLKNWGYENGTQSPLVREKMQVTCEKNLGVKFPSQNSRVREKMEATCEQRLGVKFPSQSKHIQEKNRQTCLKNWGYENGTQSPEVREKMEVTCYERLGVKIPMQSLEVREKMQVTCEERYGHKNVFGCPEIRKQIEETWLEKYDVGHPMQNVDIFYKQQKSVFKKKILVLPSGEQIIYQGYENVAIGKLLEQYLEEQIVIDNKLIPSFKYHFENKGRVYYPDMYIPHENLIIEVKSTYTYSKELSKNLAKRQACIDAGYRFEFWICSDKEVLEIR